MAIPPNDTDDEVREFFWAKVKIAIVSFVIVILLFLLIGCTDGSASQTGAIDHLNRTLEAIATEQAGCH